MIVQVQAFSHGCLHVQQPVVLSMLRQPPARRLANIQQHPTVVHPNNPPPCLEQSTLSDSDLVDRQ